MPLIDDSVAQAAQEAWTAVRARFTPSERAQSPVSLVPYSNKPFGADIDLGVYTLPNARQALIGAAAFAILTAMMEAGAKAGAAAAATFKDRLYSAPGGPYWDVGPLSAERHYQLARMSGEEWQDMERMFGLDAQLQGGAFVPKVIFRNTPKEGVQWRGIADAIVVDLPGVTGICGKWRSNQLAPKWLRAPGAVSRASYNGVKSRLLDRAFGGKPIVGPNERGALAVTRDQGRRFVSLLTQADDTAWYALITSLSGRASALMHWAARQRGFKPYASDISKFDRSTSLLCWWPGHVALYHGDLRLRGDSFTGSRALRRRVALRALANMRIMCTDPGAPVQGVLNSRGWQVHPSGFDGVPDVNSAIRATETLIRHRPDWGPRLLDFAEKHKLAELIIAGDPRPFEEPTLVKAASALGRQLLRALREAVPLLAIFGDDEVEWLSKAGSVSVSDERFALSTSYTGYTYTRDPSGSYLQYQQAETDGELYVIPRRNRSHAKVLPERPPTLGLLRKASVKPQNAKEALGSALMCARIYAALGQSLEAEPHAEMVTNIAAPMVAAWLQATPFADARMADVLEDSAAIAMPRLEMMELRDDLMIIIRRSGQFAGDMRAGAADALRRYAEELALFDDDGELADALAVFAERAVIYRPLV